MLFLAFTEVNVTIPTKTT